MPVEIYKALGQERFFLHIGDSNHDVSQDGMPPKWFAVTILNDGGGVTVSENPRVVNVFGWCECYLALENKGGTDILSPTLDGLWYLSCTGNSVVFSNHVFSVSATREK